jgi:hypothetical protein
MVRLLVSIIYLCINFGEVRSLLDLADSLDMNYSKAWERLRRLEAIDSRLAVEHGGRGRDMLITYDVDSLPDRFDLGGITITRSMLYRGKYETSGQSSEPQRRLHLVGN